MRCFTVTCSKLIDKEIDLEQFLPNLKDYVYAFAHQYILHAPCRPVCPYEKI